MNKAQKNSHSNHFGSSRFPEKEKNSSINEKNIQKKPMYQFEMEEEDSIIKNNTSNLVSKNLNDSSKF